MNAPRIQSDERGVTLNKSLAWTVVVGLLMAGIWMGTVTSSTSAAVQNLKEALADQNSDNLRGDSANRGERRELDGRLRVMETLRATDTSELISLRREMSSLSEDIKQLNKSLQQVSVTLNNNREVR